jgi:hypothetical protein
VLDDEIRLPLAAGVGHQQLDEMMVSGVCFSQSSVAASRSARLNGFGST